jgi:hypothetical protein
MKSSELEVMLEILDDYIGHVKELDNKSLLARIYGLFTFKTSHFPDIHIMVM